MLRSRLIGPHKECRRRHGSQDHFPDGQAAARILGQPSAVLHYARSAPHLRAERRRGCRRDRHGRPLHGGQDRPHHLCHRPDRLVCGERQRQRRSDQRSTPLVDAQHGAAAAAPHHPRDGAVDLWPTPRCLRVAGHHAGGRPYGGDLGVGSARGCGCADRRGGARQVDHDGRRPGGG